MMIEKGTVYYWGHLQILIIRELKILGFAKVKILDGNTANDDIVVDIKNLSSEKKSEYAISLSLFGGEYD